jgi:hypothetical protein
MNALDLAAREGIDEERVIAALLSGGGEKKRVLCARWAAQSQSFQADDAFEVRVDCTSNNGSVSLG